MKVKVPSPAKEVEIKTVKISAKCSDLCFTNLFDTEDNEVLENDGYVPSFFPDGGGDYVDLIIDIKTGQILNWDATVEEVQSWIDELGE